MFSIVIPLFNEALNIESLVDEIKSNLLNYADYEIILIDDASSDNTIEIIKNLQVNNIKILNNKKNRGQSFSTRYGIEESSHEIIITLDGDGQNDPADIPKLLDYYSLNEDIKLVGGLRVKRKDKINKIISSKIANFIRSKVLNDGCQDTGCSLKVFDKNIFLSFPYFEGIHRFLPALFKGYGHKTQFISVNHRIRKYGKSSYGNINRFFKGIRDMIKVKLILKKKN